MITLITLGLVLMLISAFYASSYLAILGLGIIFWGSILSYIKPTKHVPLSFLTAYTSTNTRNIERILTELSFTEKGLYLPPKNIADKEDSLVFIPKSPNNRLSKQEEIQSGNLFHDNHNGLLLIPPGYDLSKLIEKEFGTSFLRTDLAFIQKNLPKLLTDDLGIAENVEIQTSNSQITFSLLGSIFKEDCQETQKLSHAHYTLGCLLSSSFACILAKATGKALIVKDEGFSQDGKTTIIEYQIVEE